jgi:hypothetical protein
MTRTIQRIDPFTAARLFGAMYFSLALVVAPLFLLPHWLMAQPVQPIGGPSPSSGPGLSELVPIVILPFSYGVMGFIATGFLAWMYNVLAVRVGGIEITLDEALPPAS